MAEEGMEKLFVRALGAEAEMRCSLRQQRIMPTEPSYNPPPPKFNINWNGETLEPGVILLEPRNFDGVNATKQAGPLIMTSFGDLVWNGPIADDSESYEYANFRVQALNGAQYLTYWYGYRQEGINASTGYGDVTFLDSSYETKYTVCPKLGLNTLNTAVHSCDIDYNEQAVTPWGTLLVTAYNLTQVDRTSVNGSADGWVLDSQIHEIDITTSESIRKWSALDHLPLNASQLPITDNASEASNAWDYVHINSVSAYDRNLLVNARHTWEVYTVNRKDGDIMWTFNGETGGDWGIVPEESLFRWQYHTRVRDFGEDFVIFSMFVNHKLCWRKWHVRHRSHRGPLWSDGFGSMDYLPDMQNSTTRFLSYGQLPLLREFKVGPGANVTDLKWEARYGDDNEVVGYRAYKGAWTGSPSQEPKLSVLANGTLFVSWNGATDVDAWNVYQQASSNDTTLALVSISQYRGFETEIDAGTTGCFMVEPVVPTGLTSVNSTVVCSE
ncbi:hypothetical protein BO71DRAFT_487625 [Aspergillus ellipticus CBS 707.79]|uniref:ASST-domain-containing protein n=1 Tax=Aspergillus ellipticus CBS 707.79 TaxID=1448320 RepID=A0A319CXJ3_9EURO|nr:hypothetical protein BO71DRAFT_487625 [Aspergillus ellipticus CBS 707.79]